MAWRPNAANLIVAAMLAMAASKATYEGLWRRDSWLAWDSGLLQIAELVTPQQEFPATMTTKHLGGTGGQRLTILVPALDRPSVLTVRTKDQGRAVARLYVPARSTGERMELHLSNLEDTDLIVEGVTGSRWYGDQVGFGSIAAKLALSRELQFLEAKPTE